MSDITRHISDPGADDAIVKTGIWERRLFRRTLDDLAPLVEDADTAIEALPAKERAGIDRLAREVFSRAYNAGEPERLPAVGRDVSWQKPIHDQLGELRQWQEAKEQITGNPVRAMGFTCGLMAGLLAGVPAPKPPKPPSPPGSPSDEDGEDGLGLSESEVRQVLRRAIRRGQEEAEEMACIASLPGREPGQPTSLAAEDLAYLASQAKQSKLLQHIAKIAGRLRSISMGIRAKRATRGRSEAYGIELGRDVSRLLPIELAKLAMGGGMAAETAARIAGGRALQLAYRGEAKEGRGPLIILVDGSDSMKNWNYGAGNSGWSPDGGPIAWAKAYAMALLDIARAEKRAWHLVTYDAKPYPEHAATSDGSGQPKLAELVGALTFFPCGGTRTNVALKYALELTHSGLNARKADVILITDGCDMLDESTIKAVQSQDRRLFTVFVGTATSATIEAASHYVARINDSNDSEAARVFADVSQ